MGLRVIYILPTILTLASNRMVIKIKRLFFAPFSIIQINFFLFLGGERKMCKTGKSIILDKDKLDGGARNESPEWFILGPYRRRYPSSCHLEHVSTAKDVRVSSTRCKLA